jgi:hypothetical protein
MSTESTFAVDLTIKQMDALVSAVEKPTLTQAEMAHFKEAMAAVSATWLAKARVRDCDTVEERDALTVKKINRDPGSPFKGMVDMAGGR